MIKFDKITFSLFMFMLGLFSGLLAEYIRKFPIVVMIFIWLLKILKGEIGHINYEIVKGLL